MTPYARKCFQFLSIPFLSGLAGHLLTAYFKYQVPAEALWGAVLLVMLVAVTFAYYWTVGELRSITGAYMPVANLKSGSASTFATLGVDQYRPFYLKRPVDDVVRSRLRQKHGVVVTGRPLSGKTRSALEAILSELPGAWVMRINPADFTSREIETLVVPCPFIFVGKPVVAVVIDDVMGSMATNIDRILSRIASQVADLYVVSTCDDGEKAGELEEIRRTGRGGMFDEVLLEPLDPDQSAKLMNATWKDRGSPLLGDVTRPGYIVFGSNPVANRIRSLTPERRRLVQALRLVASSGDLPCRATHYWKVVRDVLGIDTARQEAKLLDDFVKDDIAVVNGNPARIGMQHASYLDQAYEDYETFATDLCSYVEWLTKQADARRLATLSAHCANVSYEQDLARIAIERAIEMGSEDPLHLVSLAGFHAIAGNKDAEASALDRALALATNPTEKAKLLIAHGDTLLYKLGRPVDSMEAYNRAWGVVEPTKDEETKDLVRRRSGDNLLVARDYARAEPYFAGWRAHAKGDDLLLACERLALCALGRGHNKAAIDILEPAWSGLTAQARQAHAVQIMDDFEGCLVGDMISQAQDVIISIVRGHAPWSRDKATEMIDLAVAAYRVGLSSVSEKINGSMTALREPVLDAVLQIVIRINLGVAQSELSRRDDARQTFRSVAALTVPGSGHELYSAAADAGLGDVALREGRLADAKSSFQNALSKAEIARDTNLANWARLGLAEVAVASNAFAEADLLLKQVSYISPSYMEYMRHWLAQALIRIHYEQWDDARSFVNRALALKRRRDLADMQQQFLSLSQKIASRTTPGAGQTAAVA